jgi:hypothetical protein
MINYTERLVVLVQDIVARVPALSFIDVAEVLVFARHGRSDADGAYATCHSLNLPTSEPGYYFWRDRRTGRVTRRSGWFVTKTPEVRLGARRIKYLISFVLPRFCDQTLERSRKKDFYPEFDPWIAKLDTVVHELYHIDPLDSGIRRLMRPDGTRTERSHGPTFYSEVAAMVRAYLESNPDQECYEVLRHDFNGLHARYGGVVGTTFRNFPSFPQRYIEALSAQPDSPVGRVEALKPSSQPAVYTEDDLHIHQFLQNGARRLTRKGQHRAA